MAVALATLLPITCSLCPPHELLHMEAKVGEKRRNLQRCRVKISSQVSWDGYWIFFIKLGVGGCKGATVLSSVWYLGNSELLETALIVRGKKNTENTCRCE